MRCIKLLGVVTLCSLICVEFHSLEGAQRGSLGGVGAGGGRGGGGRGGGGARPQMNRTAARPNRGAMGGGGARPGLSNVSGRQPQMGARPNLQGRPSLGGGFG